MNLKDQYQQDGVGPTNFIENRETLKIPIWERNSSYLLPLRESSKGSLYFLRWQNQIKKTQNHRKPDFTHFYRYGNTVN